MNKGSRVGDLVYPENATWPELEHMVRWFDHYLKGADNGVENEPAVRYYVMGAVGEEGAPGNVWRTAADFPNLTVGAFVGNLVPVTLGNVIGGAVLVGLVYWFVYLRPKPGS